MAERALAAVIGHPISHSLSPKLFAEFARIAQIELDYRAVDVAPAELEATLARWRGDARFIGCNVTMPHKQRILGFLDRCTVAAQACAAVNVVRRDGATLVGDNTDVVGIAATFEAMRFDPAGARAVIFGAGGGAQAVATVLGERGAAGVWIVARIAERGAALAQRACAHAPGTPFSVLELDAEAPPPAALYVNATPLGMAGQPVRPLLPANAPPGALAFDLVYRPADTPFLREARERGMRAVGGLPMLIEQALATFERWFGFRPALDAPAIARLEEVAA